MVNGVAAVWVPVLFAVQLAFTVGVAFIMSSVVVYLRDLRHALPLLLQVGLLKEIPNDPWGRPYQYRMSDKGKGYIVSYGADGLTGGAGDAADIISGGVLNDATEGTQQEAAQGGQP